MQWSCLFCMNEFYELLYDLLLKYVPCQMVGDFLSWDDWFTPWLSQCASGCAEAEVLRWSDKITRILHATGGSWASIPFFPWGKVLQERPFRLLWGGVSESLGFCSASPWSDFRRQKIPLLFSRPKGKVKWQLWWPIWKLSLLGSVLWGKQLHSHCTPPILII